KRGFGWLWRRRNNSLAPAEATPHDLTQHEPANQGYIVLAGSILRGIIDKAILAPIVEAARALRDEFAPERVGQNHVGREMMDEAGTYLRGGPASEAPNAWYILAEMIAAHPLIDMKDEADKEATFPNKQVLPPYQPDAETTRRLKFIRYLVQRGTFSEGIEGVSNPPLPHALPDYFDDVIGESDDSEA
ncbi:MAG TPA: hypothetical protein VKB76_17465, partial [Ktedonobacterales bacterium]|nr:hypothetical protein [Ktedonobacterales bacterium]